MKKRNIVLYRPNSELVGEIRGAPLSLLAISKLIDKKKYNVIIISDNLYDDPYGTAVKACEDAICIGITALSGPELIDALTFANTIRAKYTNLPIIWGGWHPSLNTDNTLKSAAVNIVVRGQGEVTFNELIDTIAEKKSIENIPGISFKYGNEIKHNPDREIRNINELPDIPFEIIDVNRILFRNEWATKAINFISSYGCPYDCGFCCENSMYHRKWNTLDVFRIIEQINKLIRDYGIDGISFYDSYFFGSENRTVQFCEEILKLNNKIKWFGANGRIRNLVAYSDETWKLIIRSGCTNILVGTESGLQEALDYMGKGLRVEETIRLAEKLRSFNLSGTFTMFCGLPWEKNKMETKRMIDCELKQSINLAHRLIALNSKNYVHILPFTPFCGSRLYNISIKKGLRSPNSLEEYAQWSSFEKCDPRNTPWISSKQARKVMFLSKGILPYLHGSFSKFRASEYSNPISRILKRFMLFFYSLSVKLRWRLNLYAYPMESKVYSFGVRLVDSIEQKWSRR